MIKHPVIIKLCDNAMYSEVRTINCASESQVVSDIVFLIYFNRSDICFIMFYLYNHLYGTQNKQFELQFVSLTIYNLFITTNISFIL